MKKLLPSIFQQANDASYAGKRCLRIKGEDGPSFLQKPLSQGAESGMNPMETSTQAASSSVHSSNRGVSGSRKTEDLMYQAVTIAAVLLLLGSLWVF